MICTNCKRLPREDDYLSSATIGDTSQQVCTPCKCQLAGVAYEPRRYDVKHEEIPEIGEGLERRKLRICGICRMACRRDDPNDDAAIRITAEDLSDPAWAALMPQIADVEANFRNAEADAQAAYEADIAEDLAEYNRGIDEAERVYAEAYDKAEQAALDGDMLEAMLDPLKDLRKASVRMAGVIYEGMIAPYKARRDAKVFKAGVPFRAALGGAWERVKHLVGTPPIEPGCYKVCADCRDYYALRIRYRLIRDRILRPEQPMNRNFLL